MSVVSPKQVEQDYLAAWIAANGVRNVAPSDEIDLCAPVVRGGRQFWPLVRGYCLSRTQNDGTRP